MPLGIWLMGKLVYRFIYVFVFTVFCTVSNTLFAQTDTSNTIFPTENTGGKAKGNVIITTDSTAQTREEIVPINKDNAPVVKKKAKFDYTGHSPKKATWMSAALPSLGQFYNRRYWKPPIIYVGFGVSLYFLIDNQMKFTVARNSFRGRMNIEGYTVDPKYTSLSADQILADRDFYRTNRDYSIIAVGAVYLLNIIDAVVDAHLRTFDVGDDLSMKFKPSFQMGSPTMATGFAPTAGATWVVKF